ncbi:MAG: hypothetical protein AAB364_02165 [Patescibacteria group bacterium]
MDKDTQTSFIPKSVLSRNTEVIPHTVSLTTVVSVLVFILAFALWGGTYAYKRLLDRSINAPCTDSSLAGIGAQSCGLQASITRARQDLDQATTIYLKRLNDKLLIGQDLANTHRTLLPVFTMLEELTLPSVYYTRFSLVADAATIEGRASSYEDIAVQTQIFARDQGRIKSFIFSDLDLDGFGNVIFKLVLNVEPEVTSYSRTLSANPNTIASPTTP